MGWASSMHSGSRTTPDWRHSTKAAHSAGQAGVHTRWHHLQDGESAGAAAAGKTRTLLGHCMPCSAKLCLCCCCCHCCNPYHSQHQLSAHQPSCCGMCCGMWKHALPIDHHLDSGAGVFGHIGVARAAGARVRPSVCRLGQPPCLA
jgi:hypothetical protein